MRNTIPVNVVVTDGVGDTYPGPLVAIELLCEGGTVNVVPAFLVQLPGPGWTVYTVAEFLAAFPGADTGGLPFHPGTLISCNGDTPWSYGVSNPFEDIFYTIDTCCGTEITDQVLALKQSLYPLTPGEPVPCGAEAIFMWLAIATEAGGWDHSVFSVTLRSSDGLTIIGPTVIGGGIAPPTRQMKLKWPEDFIGLTIGGKTLVANNVTPGVDEYNVGAFDNGEIDIKVELYTAFEFSIIDEKTFALPSTQCDDESASFSGSTSESSEDETPEIGFLFAQGTGDVSDYPGEIESWYYGLRNRAGFVSGAADYLALIQNKWDTAGQIFTSVIDKDPPDGTFDDNIPNANYDVQTVWPSRPETIADLVSGFTDIGTGSGAWSSVAYNAGLDKFEITPGVGRLVTYAWLDQL